VADGLSIATNLLANAANANAAKNQAGLSTTVSRLSSGLRINTAADDPSGLAISQSLQTQVDGFDAAVGNVQDATNAATVADGALQTTTDLLQRIRSLAVEAASDYSSNGDRSNLQAEVSQLLVEVNRIAQDTQFNGTALLSGAHAGFTPQQSAQIIVESNSITSGVTFYPLADGSFNTQTLPNDNYTLESTYGPWTFTGAGETFVYNDVADTDPAMPGEFFPTPTFGAGVQAAGLGENGATVSQTLQLPAAGTYYLNFLSGVGGGAAQLGVSVDGAQQGSLITLNPTSTAYSVPITVAAGGPHTITFTYVQPSSAPNIGIANVSVTNFAIDANTGEVYSGAPSATTLLIATAVAANANFQTTAGATPTLDGTIELQVINTGVSIAAQATFISSATGAVSVSPTLIAPGTSFSGFDNVQITAGTFGASDVGETAYVKILQNVAAATNANAPALQIQSGANEGDTIQIGFAAVNTQTLRIANINLLVSSAQDPSLGAEDAIGQIDAALSHLLTQRAALGALTVRLGEDADNDQSAAVNLQASESSIADADIGKETTEFVRDQILTSIGTSVVAASNTNAQTALQLFR
jgi:flagellin